MADIAQLGIEIDTRKLKSGEKDLAAFANSAKTATSAVMALVGAASASQLIKIADGYAQMEAKVSRYTKSQIEANNVLQQLTGYANKSGSAVSDAVNVFNSLTASLESVGASKNQILTVTEEINKLGVIGGSSVDDMRNSMRQFGQSMAGGIVRAEEFNSIIENTPEIARAIAAGMGVSIGQLRQDMLAGKLTSDAVFKALLSQVGTTNDAFAKMPRSVAQAMGQISNNFQVVVGELNKTTGATATLAAGLDSFSSSMLSASNYTDEIITGVELLALAYGSKLAGALANTIAVRLQAAAADARGVASANALTLANVELANSELVKVQASKAELLLNQQLLVSQLQLAQSETTRNAIRRQLAANSAALVATARLEQTALAGVAAANEAVTVTSYAATVATRGLNGAMALLGGPAGVIMLAAGAFMYFSSKSDDAAKSAEDFTNSINITKGALNELSTIQQQALEVKLQANILDLNKAFESQEQEVASLQKELTNYSYWTDEQKQKSTSYVDLQNRIITATAELERREKEASKTKSTLYGVQQTLNGNVKENYVVMQSMNLITGIASGIQNVFTGTLNAGNKALATRTEYVTRLNNLTTKAGQAAIMSIDQQIALEKVQGVERARLQAQFEGQQKGLVGAELQTYISKSEELYNIQVKNEEAAKKLTAANKSGASAAKEAAKSAEEYAQFSRELSRLNATEAQQIKNWQDDKLADLDLYHAQGLVKASEYEFGKQAIMAEANKRTEELAKQQREKAAQAMISASSGVDISGGLTSLKSMYDQRLLTEQQYNQQSAALKEQWKSKYAEVDNWLVNELATYKQLLADKTINEQQYNTASNQLQLQWAQKRREVLLAQRTSEQTEMQTWLANIKANMTSSTGLMTETFNSFTSNISSGLTNAIIQADSFGDAMRNAAASFAQSMIQAIIQVMAQKAVMWALEKSLGAATNAAYVGMVAGQAGAGVQLAGINAYASTAAIPIVGPAAAPAAMATAIGATAPLATAAVASAASSISGMAHDGISSVPSEGTWLLNKGERVYTNDSAKQLDQMYKNSQQSSSGNVTVNVSLQETSDTSQQGTTSQTTGDDGSVQINVFVADIRSEGSMAQVLERTYGLSRMGA